MKPDGLADVVPTHRPVPSLRESIRSTAKPGGHHAAVMEAVDNASKCDQPRKRATHKISAPGMEPRGVPRLIGSVRFEASKGELAVFDLKAIRISAHRKNVARYRALLRTELTALERDFILSRIAEEETEIRKLGIREVA